ncbi:unnamed protein product [Phaeothamnion confervicola]
MTTTGKRCMYYRDGASLGGCISMTAGGCISRARLFATAGTIDAAAALYTLADRGRRKISAGWCSKTPTSQWIITFRDCTTSGSGDAVMLHETTSRSKNVLFEDNAANRGVWGAVCVNGRTVSFEQCDFRSNVTVNAGGVYVRGSIVRTAKKIFFDASYTTASFNERTFERNNGT